MVLALVLAAVDPLVAACHDDDAVACHALGKAALGAADVGGRVEALQHFRRACELGNGPSCTEAAALIEERDPKLAAELLERATALSDLTVAGPVETGSAEAADPQPAEVADTEEDLREPDGPATGSRWGVVALLAFKTNPVGPGISAALGARYGLRARTTDPMMFMPALALVAGAHWDRTSVQPWGELRLELMGARPGGPLLPAFHGWLSAGVEVRPALFGVLPMTQPLGGYVPGPSPVRPYVGFGSGWNWLPRGSTPSSTGNTIVVWLFLVPIVIAGRVELRVSPPMTGADSTEVTLMLGCGL